MSIEIMKDLSKHISTVLYNGRIPSIHSAESRKESSKARKLMKLCRLYGMESVRRGLRLLIDSNPDIILDDRNRIYSEYLNFKHNKFPGYMSFLQSDFPQYTKDQLNCIINQSRKRDMTYNKDHSVDKDVFTNEMLSGESIHTVLDLFAGKKSFYSDVLRCTSLTGPINLVDNDLNFPGHRYNIDSKDLVCRLVADSCSFDVVDVDCFGNPLNFGSIEDYLKLSDNLLFLTLGNFVRYKNIPAVMSSWGIDFKKVTGRENLLLAVKDRIIFIGKTLNIELVCKGHRAWKGETYRLCFKLNKKVD